MLHIVFPMTTRPSYRFQMDSSLSGKYSERVLILRRNDSVYPLGCMHLNKLRDIKRVGPLSNSSKSLSSNSQE